MLKKTYLLLMVSVFLVAGCAGMGGGEDKGLADPCFKDAPQWVLTPQVEGALAATGSAKKSKAGMQFTRDAAMANARSEISRMLEVKVKTMMKDFTRVTGVGEDAVVDKVTSSVSKQVSSQVLKGTMQKNAWFSPCSELYMLVVLDTDKVKSLTKKQVLTSMKNEKALKQQFYSVKAHKELDIAIEKEFSK